MANQRNLKAFVRYDGSGRVVASSLILRKNKPRVGRWYQIPEYLCCNGTTNTTTTQGGGGTPTAWFGQISATGVSDQWKACNGFGNSIIVYTSTSTNPLPAGTYLYSDAALTTLIPYAFGAISIQGTVYLIENGRTNPLGTGEPCAGITTTTSTTTTLVYKAFTTNDYVAGGSSTSCITPDVFSETFYFIGAGNYPVIGDVVYEFYINQYIPYSTGDPSNYKKMSNNSVFSSNIEGVVLDVVACPEPTTTTTTTTIAPGIYTYILNDSGTPPLSGQFNANTNSNFAYVPKTDLSGGTLATPQLGDLITYTNGSGGGWVNAVIDFIMDDGTYWNIYSNDSPFQSGMTNGANYQLTITPPTTTTTTTALVYYTWNLYSDQLSFSSTTICDNTAPQVTLYTSVASLAPTVILYTDTALTTQYAIALGAAGVIGLGTPGSDVWGGGNNDNPGLILGSAGTC